MGSSSEAVAGPPSSGRGEFEGNADLQISYMELTLAISPEKRRMGRKRKRSPSPEANSPGEVDHEHCSRSGSREGEVEEEDTASLHERGEEKEVMGRERGEEENPERRSATGRATRTRPRPTPPEDEIERFFAKAEEQLRRQFMEKYNFDVARDAPLQGRYEWVRLKP